MRRRRTEGSVPDRLATFREADWPGDTTMERYDCWAAACRAHRDRDGWPGGAVEMIRLLHDTRCQVMGWPVPSRSVRRFIDPPSDS